MCGIFCPGSSLAISWECVVVVWSAKSGDEEVVADDGGTKSLTKVKKNKTKETIKLAKNGTSQLRSVKGLVEWWLKFFLIAVKKSLKKCTGIFVILKSMHSPPAYAGDEQRETRDDYYPSKKYICRKKNKTKKHWMNEQRDDRVRRGKRRIDLKNAGESKPRLG